MPITGMVVARLTNLTDVPGLGHSPAGSRAKVNRLKRDMEFHKDIQIIQNLRWLSLQPALF